MESPFDTVHVFYVSQHASRNSIFLMTVLRDKYILARLYDYAMKEELSKDCWNPRRKFVGLGATTHFFGDYQALL